MLENLSFSENNDFTPSITEFGVQYYDGVLLNRDFNKAFIYFERAALRNDPLAQNNLGWMYEHGEGTEKDINKAKYWYQLAAAQGHIKAINNLKLLNFKK
ncbi:tetratricopeptide repeat protein [Acinetobacter gerneri]|jgi:TPR repeat protein|uniref:tetratricopeptide repeat protein n=1 Tax=Acinetobacter gerneri TaxID=202952 RepID=UPI0023F4A89B|nr:tetratricopeptide repeat protein [Acinetobacter gerneri]MCH4243162.1 sel1 repeat family protein [Acinetobacter gerneri]